jgi:hypothetical protein
MDTFSRSIPRRFKSTLLNSELIDFDSSSSREKKKAPFDDAVTGGQVEL